jgi:hypothetical protein
MRDRAGLECLAEDVDYVGSIDKLSTYDLQWKLVEHVQVEIDMGVMTMNGQHRTGKGILVGGITTTGRLFAVFTMGVLRVGEKIACRK